MLGDGKSTGYVALIVVYLTLESMPGINLCLVPNDYHGLAIIEYDHCMNCQTYLHAIPSFGTLFTINVGRCSTQVITARNNTVSVQGGRG